MNNVTLVGRLVDNCVLRYTESGTAVASFTLAVAHDYVKEGQERGADFINCVTWRNQAENLANFTQKGQRVSLIGKLKTRTYDNDKGDTVWRTEVHAESVQFLDKPQGNNEGQGNNNNQNNNNNGNRNNNNNNNGFRTNNNQNRNNNNNRNQNR